MSDTKNETPTAPAQTIPEFIIEFGDKTNSRFRWPIDNVEYRGWWKKANLVRTEFHDHFAPLPDLPGIRMKVNVARKRVETFDPLAAADMLKVKEKAQQVIQQTFGERQGPEEPRVLDKLTDTEIKIYCWWCRRFLDNEQCVEVVGTVPTVEVIRKMPGLITTNNFDLSANARKASDIPANYRAPAKV